MKSLGISIELYLMDGTATGRWQATLSNWNCETYKISRNDLKDSDDLQELRSPGVYFLFGRDDEADQPFVYVGEGEDVLKRILQPHNFEKDGTYWTEAVISVTPDGSLDKAKIKYLENRFHQIVVESNRYIVKNSVTPTKSSLQRKIQDALEVFIMNVQLIMPALGHKVFEPQLSADQSNESKDELLYFSRNNGKGGKATGKIAEDGFWVLKGSYIFPEVAEYISPGVAKARERYADLIDENGILQKDIPFGSPSYASAFVCGKSSNGLAEWKNKDGISLKELNGEENTAITSKNKKETSDKKTQKQTAQEVSDDTKASTLLHLTGKTATAKGYVNEKGFVVIKGSRMSPTLRESCPESIAKQRAVLIGTGRVIDCIFTEDVQFASPSAAAAVLVGGSANGLVMWVNERGVKLKELKNV